MKKTHLLLATLAGVIIALSSCQTGRSGYGTKDCKNAVKKPSSWLVGDAQQPAVPAEQQQ